MRLKVTPRSRRARIDGLARSQTGEAALGVAVTEAPENGKANDAVIALLARAWRLPKSGLAVSSGAASRHKTLFVPGDPETLLPRLEGWLALLAKSPGAKPPGAKLPKAPTDRT